MSELVVETLQAEKKCNCKDKLKRFVEELAVGYGLMAARFDIKWQGDYNRKYVLCTNNLKWLLLREDDIAKMHEDLATFVNNDSAELYAKTIEPFIKEMPVGDDILGKYMHFKGNTYTVSYAAIYCPDLNTYVNIYTSDKDGEWYCREMESFYAPDEKIVNRVDNITGQKERFKKLKEDN